MRLKKIFATLAFSTVAFSGSTLAAELTLYVTMPEKYATQVLEQFTKDTNIKVNFMRLSAGEILTTRL